MKIAVNTRLLLRNKLEGIGWFTYETFRRITQWQKNHEFIFIFDRKWDESFIFSDNITPVKAIPQARHPILWYWWFEYSIPQILKAHQADMFISPDGYLSLKTPVPSVAVIHDINFWHLPKDLPWLTSHYYKHFFPKFARKAERIATVSHYSKDDLQKSFGLSAEKIDVVYNGANKGFNPLSESEKALIRRQFTNGSTFFLYIGSLHPRKNIERLLKAYELFRNSCNSSLKLVIAGDAMFKTQSIKKTYQNHMYRQDIIFTGHVKEEVLKQLLPAATALTFVPYFEGFGMPVVEAMHCDVPVLTGNLTSLPEVAGNAALLVNPYSVREIASGMQQIVENEALRNTLIENGRLQRTKFSWDKTASSLWNTMMKQSMTAI